MESPDLEKLYDLAKELKKAKNAKTVLDIVSDHLPKVIGAKYCSFFIKNPSSSELELKAHNHQNIGDDPFIHVNENQESIMNLVISKNTSMMVRNIEEEIGIENKDKYSTKSFLCILISHEDKVLGVLNLLIRARMVFPGPICSWHPSLPNSWEASSRATTSARFNLAHGLYRRNCWSPQCGEIEPVQSTNPCACTGRKLSFLYHRTQYRGDERS
jgi:hypothetical protein